MRKKIILSVILMVGAALVLNLRGESAARKAHRLCEDCGLTKSDTDGLIETMRGAPGSREALLESFFKTFPKRDDAEPCLPCANAVLDAANAQK
jgi:hypothetical protein